jgi:biotin carboxylase
MGKRILQLGAGQMMVATMQILRHAGYETYAVDRDPRAPGFAAADGFAVVDIADGNSVAKYARQIKADLILAVNDAAALSASYASERLGLPGIPPEVALRCVDKGLMREAWQKAGLAQPRFRVVRDPSEIPGAAAEVAYPLIVKPALNWGSRGVSFVEDESALPWAMEFAEANSRTRKFIVEEYICGTEMTVEGLVQNGRPQILAKSDKEAQAHPRFRVAMALNYPAEFEPWQLRCADELVSAAVRATGLVNGAIHCECMINAQGVYLLELGARGGGGHIFHTIVEAVSGVSMPTALVKILLGEPVEIAPTRNWGACYRFFAPPPGVFHSVAGLDEARMRPGILDIGFTMQPGTVVEPVSNDASRPGYVVSSHMTRVGAMARAAEAIATLRFNLSPSGPRP